MKKALAIGLAAVMAVSMSAPVFAEDEGKGIAKEDLKVGMIYIGDENEGYTEAHLKAVEEMKKNLGLSDDQVVIKTNIKEDEGCYDAAVDLAEQGCNIVIANSFGHESYILQAAADLYTGSGRGISGGSVLSCNRNTGCIQRTFQHA